MKTCICCKVELLRYNNNGNFCPKCHSVFAEVSPTDEELALYYKNFNEGYFGGGRSLGSSERQLQYANKFLKLVERFSNKKTLIDIGSSTSPFPNIAYSKYYSVTVVDFIKPQNLNPNITFIGSYI